MTASPSSRLTRLEANDRLLHALEPCVPISLPVAPFIIVRHAISSPISGLVRTYPLSGGTVIDTELD